MKKIISYFSMLTLCLGTFAFGFSVSAATTMQLTNTAGDAVEVEVTGEPSSSIRFSFLPPGASTVTTITLGTTNSSGNFSTSISSGGYGIPAGSPAYATIEGSQSATTLWPSYSSSISLSQTNLQIAVGQSTTISSSHNLILSANSLSSSIGTAISGSRLTVTGLNEGTGTLILCGTNAGCESVAVTVGEHAGQTQLSLSDNNITIDYHDSENVTIFGGSNNGYNIESNTNSTAVSASISGTSDQIFLYGNSAGSATIKICSVESDTNCINLYVTALSSTANTLSFSKNNFTLIPGLSQNVTVSGGPDSQYYISSNSNSVVATASISGSTMTVVGGNTTGSTIIKVCSATKSGICSNLNVTNNAEDTTPSETVLAFSQNVVSVAKDSSTNVTVSGGDGSGYSISSNSDSDIATASISGGSNIISVYGNEEGSAIVEVCSIDSSSVCASIYVNVGPASETIYFSQDNVSLTEGQKLTIIITGGTDDNKIDSISNSDIVSASLSNNGNIIILTGGTVVGTATIKVCDGTDNNNCSDLTAKLTASDSQASSGETSPGTDDEASDASSSASAAAKQLEQILSDTSAIYSSGISGVLENTGSSRNEEKENETLGKYINNLIADEEDIPSDNINLLNYFITYGTLSTKSLGEGERAGVLNSYKKAFGKLPQTETEWSDAIKIANGRWPSETSQSALDSAKVEFRKVYDREPDMDSPNDNAAVSVIAYGLRPSQRNLDSEKAAIKSFRYVYGHDPVSALAWDIVRAIAYSGATR